MSPQDFGGVEKVEVAAFEKKKFEYKFQLWDKLLHADP